MCELFMIRAMVVAMYKIADIDEQPGWLWGLIALGIGFACVALIPLPFLRVLIAGVLVIGVMIAAKMIQNRPEKKRKR